MKVNDKGERNFSDIFVVHSTLPNHISYRNKKYGSYFIQILCDVFQNYACRYSVQDLLLLVSFNILIFYGSSIYILKCFCNNPFENSSFWFFDYSFFDNGLNRNFFFLIFLQ